MRAFLVSFVALGHACAHPAAAPAPAPLASRSAAPAAAPVAVAKATWGRAIEPGGEWVDLMIEGSDQVSMDACTRLLAQVTGNITHPCEARPLKPIGGHGVALLTLYELDERSLALDDLLSGNQTTVEPPPFKGRRSGYEPHPSTESCDAEVAKRNDTERRNNLENKRPPNDSMTNRRCVTY